MAANDQTQHTTTTMSEETNIPLGTSVQKPKEVHERPLSSGSSDIVSDDVDLEKQKQPDDDMSPVALAKSEAESVYPGTAQTAAVMLCICLTIFLVALDRTIIATAIPKITDDFNSIDDIGWYGSAFLLTSCCFQLLLGRVYTFYTPKYVFLILIFLFEVGSAVCGAAPSSVAFIIGRAIAGVGAAGIMSGAVILMVEVVPLRKRPMYQGFFGACFGVASVIGPLLGGVFTSDVTWRWCFYINLPIGGVVMGIITFLLKPSEATQKGLTIRQQLGKLDLLGEFFLLPCIVCLLLALQWGGSTYPWSDGRVIALFTLFGVLFIAFVAVQVWKPETATLPKRIILNRNIIGGMWFVFCLASAMMILVYYLPIWFQAIKGNTAVESGIRTIPLVLALVVGTITAGQFTGRIGYYTPFLYGSAVIMPIGCGLITMFKVDTGEGMWIGFQILVGIGIGMGMQQSALAAQTVLSRKDVPTGVSLMFFTQMLAGAIFISVGQNVFDSKLVSGLVALVDGLSPGDIVNTGATNLRNAVPKSQLPEVLEVYNSAVRQTFVVATAIGSMCIFGALLVEWRSVKGKAGPEGGKHAAEKKSEPATNEEVKA